MNKKIEQLAKPFPYEDIEWRVGSTTKDKTRAIALAYITSRAAMNRLDEVMGPENWQVAFRPIPGVGGDTKGYLARLKLRIGDEWICKEDGANESDIESIKGGLSDAFKRVAVQWGIGRYLYDLPTVWIPIESFGNSYKLSITPDLPAWALPEDETEVNVEQVPESEAGPKGSFCSETKTSNEKVVDNDCLSAIELIRMGIDGAIVNRQGRGATEKQRNFAHGMLKHVIPDDDKRVEFCQDLFGVTSWSAVQGEEVGAFLDWLSPKKVASVEGKSVYRPPGEVDMLINRAISR